jgi:Bacterial regulatory proteins, lacI family
MPKTEPGMIYVYRGPSHDIPWREIRTAIRTNLGPHSEVTLTLKYSAAEGKAAKREQPYDAQSRAISTGRGIDAPRKQATMADVAREAAVSISTVSRVLNGGSSVSRKAQESVDAAVNRLGYIPNEAARALVRSIRRQVENDAGIDDLRAMTDAQTAVPASAKIHTDNALERD